MRLIDEITSSALFCSLHGTKRVFERNLGLKNIYFVFHNNNKYNLSRQANPTYPYHFLKITSVGISRDEKSIRAIQKCGLSNRGAYGMTQNNVTNATVHKFFMFPTKVACEFHYFHNDLVQMTKFLEAFLLLSVTESFNFMVKMNDEAKWVCRIEVMDDTLGTPDADLEAPNDPAGQEVVVNFTLHTHLGFVRDVAKVNNFGRPTITFGMSDEGDTETVPDEMKG